MKVEDHVALDSFNILFKNGVVSGEEFNYAVENASSLILLISRGLGLTSTQLKAEIVSRGFTKVDLAFVLGLQLSKERVK